MHSNYQIDLTLTRDMLGTNPCDPNVHDVHILDRQRKIIQEQSKINKTVNKYLDQLDISKDKGEEESTKILDKLEALIGTPLSEQDRELAMKGELAILRETFKELDIKGITVFFWDKEKNLPCIGDHMIYGFLKASAEAIGRTLPKKNATILNSISYTQSIINQHVRCTAKFITFDKDIRRNSDGSASYLQRSLRAMTAQGPRISLAKSEVVEAGAKLSLTLKVFEGSPLTQEALETLFSYSEFVGLGQWRSAGNGTFTATITKLK